MNSLSINFIDHIQAALLPEVILTIFILLIGILCFSLPKKLQNSIFYVSVLGVIASMASLLSMSFLPEVSAFWGSFVSNNFTLIFRVIILFGTLITLFLSKDYVSGFGKSIGEYYFLLLTATLGALLLVGANDLVMLFVGLETLSISSFILCGYTKLDKLSNEASLKYLIFGAVSTAVMLYGFSFLYGMTGETNLVNLSMALANYEINAVLILAFLLTLGGFLFKISAAPFHAWAPDVYEGAPVPIAAYLSVVSKTAGFAILIRIIAMLFANVEMFNIILAVIAVITITVGNLMAMGQKSLRRLFAYSSIAHAGYVLLGLSIMTSDGVTAIVFYLMTYLFMNFGVWAVVEIFAAITGKDHIDDYNGLAYKHRYFTLGFALCLLSLAGIPITAGFFSKFYLFKAVIMAGYEYMPFLILALINTVVALFYYMRVVKALYVKPENKIQLLNIPEVSFPMRAVMAVCVAGVLLLGILATPVIETSELANKITHKLSYIYQNH